MSGGGFIPDPTPLLTAGPSTAASSSSAAPTSTSSTAQRPLRKLTPKQEERLRNWLDDALLKLERDFNRRTDPESPIPTLQALLTRIDPLLNLILSIPPIDPSTYLRISYLLSFTSTIRECVVGYPLIPHATSASNASPATLKAAKDLLDTLLDFLDELDLGWRTVLRGEAWDAGSGSARTREGSWREGTMDPSGYGGGDGGGMVRQVMIGKEMSMTDKIRLRSSILSLREKLLSWIEPQLPTLHPRISNIPESTNGSMTGDSASEAEDDIDVKMEEGEDEEMDDDEGTVTEMGEAGVVGEVQGRIVRLLNGTLEMLAL